MMTNKKILFIKFYALGDVITTLDFLSNLIKQTKYQLTLLTSSDTSFIYKNILSYNGNVLEFKISKNKLSNFINLFFSNLWFLKINEVWLGHRSFVLAIFFLFITRSKVLYLGEKNFFNLIVPLGFEKAKNHTLEYYRFHNSLDKQPFIYFPKANSQFNFFKKLNNNIFLSVGSGNKLASGKNKMWPIKNFIKIIESLPTYNFILLGSIDEIHLGKVIENKIENQNIINLIGKTDLNSLIDIFKYCDLFLGHDSGLSWFASITKTKSIILHGPTRPNYYGPSNLWIYKLQSSSNCLNCYDFKEAINSKMYKCNNNICLKELTVSEVLQKMKKILVND